MSGQMSCILQCLKPSRTILWCRLPHPLIQCFSPLHQLTNLLSQRMVPECKFDVIFAGPMPGFLPASTDTKLKLHATSVDITQVYQSWCRGSLQISRYCDLHPTHAINFLLLSLQLSVP